MPSSGTSVVAEQRQRVAVLKDILAAGEGDMEQNLRAIADALVRKSVWIVGGDGWAYDIGFGGLDHVLASGRDVNILVLDTQVYSNTGGQASKATPRGAVAKFAAGGKAVGRKDLGLFATGYGNVYVGQVAVGADNAQTVKVFGEAETWNGPSLIIAYSTCIAHGIDMSTSMSHQAEAVKSGFWPCALRPASGRRRGAADASGQPSAFDTTRGVPGERGAVRDARAITARGVRGAPPSRRGRRHRTPSPL